MKKLSKLERFDKTLTELDVQAEKLKNTSNAYHKLNGLVAAFEKIKQQFEANSKSLDSTTKKQAQIYTEIKQSLDDIRTSNKENHEALEKLNDALVKKLQDAMEAFRKENREFYLDFEKVVRIKLDEHKSEIKHLIENERLQIKEIIVAESTKQTNLILQYQTTLKNWVLGLGISVLLLLIVILIKIFL